MEAAVTVATLVLCTRIAAPITSPRNPNTLHYMERCVQLVTVKRIAVTDSNKGMGR